MWSVNRVMQMQMIESGSRDAHRFLYLQHTARDFASRFKNEVLIFFRFGKTIP